MTKNHGNEDCRGTVNMYQIACNLPMESMNTTQNSQSNNFKYISVGLFLLVRL